MTRTWSRRIYSALCGLLSIACLWFAFDDWQTWKAIATTQIMFFGFVSAFFMSTSLAVFRARLLGLWLAGISGAFLTLYALAVVLMGWEDVGGAGGAIPLALGTGLVGALGLMIGIGGGLERGQDA